MAATSDGEPSTNRDPILTASVEFLITRHGGKPVARSIPETPDNRLWFVIERTEDGLPTRLAVQVNIEGNAHAKSVKCLEDALDGLDEDCPEEILQALEGWEPPNETSARWRRRARARAGLE